MTEKPQHLPFVPAETAVQKYPITEYQPVYFVAESFETAKKQLQDFASTLSRPFELYYNPITQCVDKLDSVEKIAQVSRQLQQQIALVNAALARLS